MPKYELQINNELSLDISSATHYQALELIFEEILSEILSTPRPGKVEIKVTTSRETNIHFCGSARSKM